MTRNALDKNFLPADEPRNLAALKTHNALIGDRAALDRAWDTDGYWFFKGVLDKRPLARLRRVMVEELAKQGIVDPAAADATDWDVRPKGGADVSRLHFRLETLAESQPWRDFVFDPAIHPVIAHLLGDEPFWLPIVEYRTAAPAADRTESRFGYIHQDAPDNRGLPFRIVWIPLCHIDESVGGMALAEGMAQPINRQPHAADGANMRIPLHDIPPDRWRQTICEPGDLLLMNKWTPHVSYANHSDRFRLSLDHRVIARSDGVPVVGDLQTITPSSVTVKQEDGDVTLRITPETYFRRKDGSGKLADADIVENFHCGDRVLAAHADGKVVSIRPVLL